MLNIYTAQYNYKGPNRTDITSTTATLPWDIFAPTRDMVRTYLKSSKDVLAEQVYIPKYEKIVAAAFRAREQELISLIHSDETRVFVCFCKSGDFCHRVLLARYFESLGAVYHEEIYPWYPIKGGLK